MARHLLDKYGQVLDSVLGNTPVVTSPNDLGRRSFWISQDACWRYLLGAWAPVHERKAVIRTKGLVV